MRLWGGRSFSRMNAQKAVKQLRNQINRQTNCDHRNLGKTAARANTQNHPGNPFCWSRGATLRVYSRLQPSGWKSVVLFSNSVCLL